MSPGRSGASASTLYRHVPGGRTAVGAEGSDSGLMINQKASFSGVQPYLYPPVELADWPESDQRVRSWFSLEVAAKLVAERDLVKLFGSGVRQAHAAKSHADVSPAVASSRVLTQRRLRGLALLLLDISAASGNRSGAGTAILLH
jgi:hypothetical protein